jgi:hypothetical protein
VPAGKATEGSEPDAEAHDVDHAVERSGAQLPVS